MKGAKWVMIENNEEKATLGRGGQVDLSELQRIEKSHP